MRGIDWVVLVLAFLVTVKLIGAWIVWPLYKRYTETEYERALRLRIEELKKRKKVTFGDPK